jgi:hypothetical protein
MDKIFLNVESHSDRPITQFAFMANLSPTNALFLYTDQLASYLDKRCRTPGDYTTTTVMRKYRVDTPVAGVFTPARFAALGIPVSSHPHFATLPEDAKEFYFDELMYHVNDALNTISNFLHGNPSIHTIVWTEPLEGDTMLGTSYGSRLQAMLRMRLRDLCEIHGFTIHALTASPHTSTVTDEEIHHRLVL